LFEGAKTDMLLVKAESAAADGAVVDDVGVGQRDRPFLPLFFSTSAAPSLISHELARGNPCGAEVELVGRPLYLAHSEI